METLKARFGQKIMYVSFAAAAICLYIGAIAAVMHGKWLMLFPGMLLLSPVMMAVLRDSFEPPLTRSFIKPSVMSWSFVVGDILVLPAALSVAARGWQQTVVTQNELLLMGLTHAVAGLLAIIAFRKIDGDRYRTVGWGSSLKSPTKVWHDCVVIPVVVALLMWLMIPQLLLGAISADTIIVLLLLVVFVSLVVVDGLRPPDPTKQHVRWDSRRFQPEALS